MSALKLSGLLDARWRDWLRYIRPGDWLVVCGGFTGAGLLFPLFWSSTHADRAVVRRDGELITEIALTTTKRIEVQGPRSPPVALASSPIRGRVNTACNRAG
jgi:hypothetical protein